jgi:nicotinamidase-related amidase
MNQSPNAIEAQRAALLVMDYQAGIIGRISDSGTLLENVARAIDIARHHHIRVAYVRVAFDQADIAAIPSANKSFSRLAHTIESFRSDAPATQIAPKIAPHPGDIVVRKTRVGAFSTTDLRERLQSAGITTLILAGISTSGVVLSTVRDAADRDYRLFVLSDACADPDPQVHEFLVSRIYPNQADVITVADLETLMPRRSQTDANSAVGPCHSNSSTRS